MRTLLEWLDDHSPHTLGGDDDMFRSSDDQYEYTIIQFRDNVFGAYANSMTTEEYGYIGKISCKIECGPGIVCAAGLKPSCEFHTIQEAKQACEQYSLVHQ